MPLSKVNVQCFESHQAVAELEETWNELHKNCTAPSVYNGFNFVYESIRHFYDKDVTTKVFTLTDSETNLLLAVFPLQHLSSFWYIFKINTYEYTALDEVDKPYPVIRDGYFEICWNAFLLHLKESVSNWDHLQLIELPDSYSELNLLPDICAEQDFIYRVNPSKQGPIVSLEGSWDEYWSQHKKMRKKIRKMEKEFGDQLVFEVHNNNWNWCIDQYIKLEQKSWKKGKIGISSNPQNETFYRRLFERLEATENLQFGFLSVNGELVSGEIAYTMNDTVYFCHGCFDQAYNKYSPGMVSTSFFIKHFYGGRYKAGDFLCGYANYLNDWSDSLMKTYKIDIFMKRPKVRAIFALRIINKVFIVPLRKLFKMSV